MVLKFVSPKYVSLQFFQPTFYAYIFRRAFMKTIIKDPLWAIFGGNDCHAARPEEFISLQLKHFFLACCHLDLPSVCNFLFPVVLCSVGKLQTKTATIILDGASRRLLKQLILTRLAHRSLCFFRDISGGGGVGRNFWCARDSMFDFWFFFLLPWR